MTFTPKVWTNGTLVDATAMIDLETRLGAYSDIIGVPGVWKPSDHGLIAWAFDPSNLGSGVVMAAAGTIATVRLKIALPVSITNVVISILTGGTTLTSGQCLAALYQGGTLIGVTADQSVSWASAGTKSMALVGGPFSVTAGEVIVAMFANGTAVPQPARAYTQGAAVNMNLSNANSRYGTADTGRTTTMPATLATISNAANAFWAGVS